MESIDALRAIVALHAPKGTPAERIEAEAINILTYFRMAQAQDPALTQVPSTQQALNILYALNQSLKAVVELAWSKEANPDYGILERYIDIAEFGRTIEAANEKVVRAYKQLENTPEVLAQKGRPALATATN